MGTLDECKNVTRIEVIDTTGRLYTIGSYLTEVQLQDEGRTLKVFVSSFPYVDIFKKDNS